MRTLQCFFFKCLLEHTPTESEPNLYTCVNCDTEYIEVEGDWTDPESTFERIN